MRFLGSVYLFAGFCSTIALTSAAAQAPSPVPPQAPAIVQAPRSARPPAPSQAPGAAPAQGAAIAQAPAAAPAQAAAIAQAPGAAPARVPAGAAQQAPGVPLPAPARPDEQNAGPAPAASLAAPGGVSAPGAAGAAATPPVGTDPPGATTAGASEVGAAPATEAVPAGEGARLAKRRDVVVAASHDGERPVAPPEPERPSETGFAARLSFGISGALWISGGDTKLSRPFWLGLDLGYAFSRNLTIIARATSWLPYDDLANEFIGAGVVYRLFAEGVYVAPALGLSFTRQGPASEWSHYFQGLALEADVGQIFPLTANTSFSLGAHFQIGTPLFGTKPDAFTSLLAGIFVAFGLR